MSAAARLVASPPMRIVAGTPIERPLGMLSAAVAIIRMIPR